MAELDDSVLRNLDTQHRRLAEIEAHLDALLAGEEPAALPAAPDRPETYDRLTATNDALRAERSWDEVDLDAALSPEALAEFELWRRRRRMPWGVDDAAAVAFAGVLGVAATVFDDKIDKGVKERLKALHKTPLIQRWEKDAKRMPIDYMGKGFGGRLHRVRSAGHDIGRPFEALRQIRRGEFRGFRWEYGVRHTVTATGPKPGVSYVPAATLGEAIVLWGKHLVADVVTETSLPLPGWTKLYELDDRTLRTFAHQAYGNGADLRSFAVSTLPVMTTEIVVRTHVHGRAMLRAGTAALNPAEVALRTELLLAGHALVGAASLGKATTTVLTSAALPAVTRYAKAFAHINWPVLMKAATTALDVARDARARRSTAKSWDELLADLAQPWQLAESVAVEEILSQESP
ncbi:hypothetical protein [Pseudonocardia thermophila]|uniref:hypothetical protein n=1 Tax=Pseudonocardia thermophila TaxID=1848 RepID=UPI00248D789B|nr:hypothetical protein [Pseudonocardia thermophila]